MKQMTIMEQSKRMGDRVYAHELEAGDRIALTAANFKKRQASEVYSSEFKSDGFGNYSGKLVIKTKTWSKSKKIFLTKTKEVTKPKEIFYFLSKSKN